MVKLPSAAVKFIGRTSRVTDDLLLNNGTLKKMGASSAATEWITHKGITSTGKGLSFGKKGTGTVTRGFWKNVSRSKKKLGLKIARFKRNSPTLYRGMVAAGGIGAGYGAYRFWGEDAASFIDKLFSKDIVKLIDNYEDDSRERNGSILGLYIDQDDDRMSPEELQLLMILDLLPSHIKNYLIATMNNDIMAFCVPDGDIERMAVPVDCDITTIYEAMKDVTFLFSKEIAPFVVKGKFTVGRQTHILLGTDVDKQEAVYGYGVSNEAIPYIAHAYAMTGGLEGEHKESISLKAKSMYARFMTEFRLTGSIAALNLAEMAAIYR